MAVTRSTLALSRVAAVNQPRPRQLLLRRPCVNHLAGARFALVCAAEPFILCRRARSAACGSGERGLLDVSVTRADTLAALSGRWARCSGALPERLEPDAMGAVHALDGAGKVVHQHSMRAAMSDDARGA